jgi:hypothetical protein
VKLSGTYQLVVYAYDVLVGSVHTIQKNTGAIVVASNEIGLEVDVNAEKTSYVVISRDQNAVQNHSIKSNNKSFDERVEHFRYL